MAHTFHYHGHGYKRKLINTLKTSKRSKSKTKNKSPEKCKPNSTSKTSKELKTLKKCKSHNKNTTPTKCNESPRSIRKGRERSCSPLRCIIFSHNHRKPFGVTYSKNSEISEDSSATVSWDSTSNTSYATASYASTIDANKPSNKDCCEMTSSDVCQELLLKELELDARETCRPKIPTRSSKSQELLIFKNEDCTVVARKSNTTNKAMFSSSIQTNSRPCYQPILQTCKKCNQSHVPCKQINVQPYITRTKSCIEPQRQNFNRPPTSESNRSHKQSHIQQHTQLCNNPNKQPQNQPQFYSQNHVQPDCKVCQPCNKSHTQPWNWQNKPNTQSNNQPNTQFYNAANTEAQNCANAQQRNAPNAQLHHQQQRNTHKSPVTQPQTEQNNGSYTIPQNNPNNHPLKQLQKEACNSPTTKAYNDPNIQTQSRAFYRPNTQTSNNLHGHFYNRSQLQITASNQNPPDSMPKKNDGTYSGWFPDIFCRPFFGHSAPNNQNQNLPVINNNGSWFPNTFFNQSLKYEQDRHIQNTNMNKNRSCAITQPQKRIASSISCRTITKNNSQGLKEQESPPNTCNSHVEESNKIRVKLFVHSGSTMMENCGVEQFEGNEGDDDFYNECFEKKPCICTTPNIVSEKSPEEQPKREPNEKETKTKKESDNTKTTTEKIKKRKEKTRKNIEKIKRKEEKKIEKEKRKEQKKIEKEKRKEQKKIEKDKKKEEKKIAKEKKEAEKAAKKRQKEHEKEAKERTRKEKISTKEETTIKDGETHTTKDTTQEIEDSSKNTGETKKEKKEEHKTLSQYRIRTTDKHGKEVHIIVDRKDASKMTCIEQDIEFKSLKEIAPQRFSSERAFEFKNIRDIAPESLKGMITKNPHHRRSSQKFQYSTNYKSATETRDNPKKVDKNKKLLFTNRSYRGIIERYLFGKRIFSKNNLAAKNVETDAKHTHVTKTPRKERKSNNEDLTLTKVAKKENTQNSNTSLSNASKNEISTHFFKSKVSQSVARTEFRKVIEIIKEKKEKQELYKKTNVQKEEGKTVVIDEKIEQFRNVLKKCIVNKTLALQPVENLHKVEIIEHCILNENDIKGEECDETVKLKEDTEHTPDITKTKLTEEIKEIRDILLNNEKTLSNLEDKQNKSL